MLVTIPHCTGNFVLWQVEQVKVEPGSLIVNSDGCLQRTVETVSFYSLFLFSLTNKFG